MGGYHKEVPVYKDKKNSPFVTNEEKKIYKQKQGQKQQNNEMNKEKGEQPLLDMKVYQPEQQQQSKPSYPMYAPLPMNPLNPYQYGYQQPQMPIVVNKYNVSMANAGGDHAMTSAIIEDVLPGKNFHHTLNTIGERLLLVSYIRKILIKVSDGEDISLDPSAKHSLFHFMKMIDLNPYNSNPFTNNPYKSLPRGMLLYRSAYPIRYDESSGQVIPAKNAIGLNIRIYRLSIEEYNSRLANKKKLDFDVWRELHYYEYIKESIIKAKLCPNFAILYAWYVDENCDVDFDKLDIIKFEDEPRSKLMGLRIEDCDTNINNKNKMDNNMMQLGGDNKKGPILKVEHREDMNINMYMNMKTYSKKAMIALTESPNQNIYGWGTKTYEVDGIRKIMTSSGYHDDDVWMSIIFQIMAGMYAMQLKGICIKDFSFVDNVYIKDLHVTEYMAGYWLYNIDGIDYYIPNYGYLVMIDSNFKDIKDAKDVTNKNKKMNCKIFGDNLGLNNNECFENFRKNFNDEIFGLKFANDGFVAPGDKIIELFQKINRRCQIKNPSNDTNIDPFTNNNIISYYIHEYMQCFLHNRVGTLIKAAEKTYVDVNGTHSNNFVCGEMLLHNTNAYRWCVYVKPLPNSSALIFCSDDTNNKNCRHMTVSMGDLSRYLDETHINQEYDPEKSKLSLQDKIDTYKMDISMIN
jgi:hypothetical protein